MNILYCTKTGSLIAAAGTPTHHQQNLQYLASNSTLNRNIRDQALVEIAAFERKAIAGLNAHINSGNIAVKVCQHLGLPQNAFHHGLVGSALNDEFSNYSSHVTVIASKGENQTWFDYFPNLEIA